MKTSYFVLAIDAAGVVGARRALRSILTYHGSRFRTLVIVDDDETGVRLINGISDLPAPWQRSVVVERVDPSAADFNRSAAKSTAAAYRLLAPALLRGPDICGFISEQVYDGRLQSEDHCAVQRVDDGPVVGGAGLRLLGAEHEGNRTSSTEETEVVARVFDALVGREWTDHERKRSPLGVDDVLVVAPYNAQIHLLAQCLPDGARVGTVDKF